MNRIEHPAKPAPKTGRFSSLAGLLRAKGSGAPSFRRPTRTPTLARVFIAAALALFALGATAASAAPPTSNLNPIVTHSITTAHLTGTVDPADHETSYCFEYSTDPGTVGWSGFCYQGSLASGSGSAEVSRDLTDLSAATEYKVRLTARNFQDPDVLSSEGSFTTDPAPNVPVLALEPATPSFVSAHIQGTLDPEGGNLNAPGQPIPIHWALQLSESGDPGTFNDVASGDLTGAEAESATAIDVPASPAELTGLTPGHTYSFRLLATYAGQQAITPAATFETEAVNPPSAANVAITAITATSAHLEGTVNSGGTGPGEELATYTFRCEPECPGLAGPAQITPDGAPHTVAANATGLEPNTPYTVILTATNPGGEQAAVALFATKALAPEATTFPFVGPASSSAARVYGTLNAHNSTTTYFFEYGPTAAYGTSIPASENAPTAPGNNPQTVSQDLTGLTPTNTYHYRIVAESPAGTVKGADQVLTTAAPPPPCSPAEEQLRSENNSTQLPDCRAWEQVTPAFKDGGAALFTNAISDDGSRVITSSLGGYAGVESNQAGAFYQSERSGSGWATGAVSPPASQFSAREPFGFSADLSRSLWKLRTPSQSYYAEDLYRREPSGAFVEVGPLKPPSAVEGPPAGRSSESFGLPTGRAGASSDLSHVLFQVKSNYAPWPFDTTSPNSFSRALYEYVGTGNQQPALVGLDNAGDLLSECATVLGSILKRSGNATYNADIYNAISATGETIFFTAESSGECASLHPTPEVNEVYARLGQFPIHTVAISEPTAADCAACDTEAANRANAEFQGASEDGSEVFFLTEQELLPGNPGRNLYEYDFNAPAGSRVAAVSHLASEAPAGVLGVARVSEDGSHVYFVAEGALTAANAEGNSPTAGAPNLYLVEHDAAHPAGRRAFIATLSPGDAGDFQSGFWSATDNRRVQATPDGRFLAFQSVADLTPGDTNSVPQVFEYDAEREELVRVSVGEAGYPAGAESADANASTLDSQGYSSEAMPTNATTHLAISADGATIVFSSRGALTRSAEPAAAAGALTVYRYHSAGALQSGSVAAISNGSGTTTATLIGIDASGEDVFFANFGPLLAGDVDTQKDLYDARAGGGFPAPSIPPTCSGESGCRGQISATPPKAAPATPGFHGPGNQPPKPPCPKGKVRKHGRCVKQHKSRKHHRSRKSQSRRTANHKRGGQK